MRAGVLVAHAGHWALWVIYSVPVVVVVGAILYSVLQQRRVSRLRDEEED